MPLPIIEDLTTQLERQEALDPLIDRIADVVRTALPPEAARTRALQGEWLGHPLHPMLTDLPIGCWTSAWVLDLVGGERSQPAADLFVGLGVVSAVPTALAGWADWSTLPTPARRVGVVHVAAIAAATGLYAGSWVARRRGARTTGVVLGHLGATVATVGGYLGGHLAFASEPTQPGEPSEARSPASDVDALA